MILPNFRPFRLIHNLYILLFGYELWPSVLLTYCCVTNYPKLSSFTNTYGGRRGTSASKLCHLAYLSFLAFFRLLAEDFSYSSLCEPLCRLPECPHSMIAGFLRGNDTREKGQDGSLSFKS